MRDPSCPFDTWGTVLRPRLEPCSGLPAGTNWPLKAVQRLLAGTDLSDQPEDLGTILRGMHADFAQRWLNEIRQLEAERLASQGLPTKEIAARLGYNHTSNFCRAFRKGHGLAIASFRPRTAAPKVDNSGQG